VTIHHFAGDQNLVFVPALLALLVATVLVCLPVVLVTVIRRSRRRVLITAAATVLAVLALGVAGWQAALGFGALNDERAQVRAQVADRYGIDLTAAEVSELVDGGRPKRSLPEQAAAVGLTPADKAYPLRLVPEEPGADAYGLRFGGKPLEPNG
jgi:hypothetical protein